MAEVLSQRATIPGPFGGRFSGDHDSMVDRLIEACAAAKQGNHSSALRTRDLVPVASAWLEEPMKCVCQTLALNLLCLYGMVDFVVLQAHSGVGDTCEP